MLWYVGWLFLLTPSLSFFSLASLFLFLTALAYFIYLMNFRISLFRLKSCYLCWGHITFISEFQEDEQDNESSSFRTWYVLPLVLLFFCIFKVFFSQTLCTSLKFICMLLCCHCEKQTLEGCTIFLTVCSTWLLFVCVNAVVIQYVTVYYATLMNSLFALFFRMLLI